MMTDRGHGAGFSQRCLEVFDVLSPDVRGKPAAEDFNKSPTIHNGIV